MHIYYYNKCEYAFYKLIGLPDTLLISFKFILFISYS